MAVTRILKSGAPDLYDARIKIAYSQGWDPSDPVWKQLYSTINLTTEDVRSTYISGLGQWQKKEFGENVGYDGIYQGYDVTITPATYALAFTIEEETVEDEPHGLLGQDLSRNLAAMGQYTMDVLAASLFNNGFGSATTTWQTGGDSQYFFDTDHPILSGGVYPNNPTAECDFSVAALQASLTRLAKTQGPRGEIQALKGELVLTSTDNRWLVEEILGSPTIPYIASNTPNVARLGLKSVFWSQLTDADMWAVRAKMAPMANGRPSGPGATTVFAMRRQPTFDRDNVFDSGDRRYKGSMRLGFGWLDWRGWDGSSGG